MFIHYSLVKFFERTNFWGILADQGQWFYIIMTDSNFKDKPHLNGQLSLIISVLAMKSINIQVTLSSMTSSSSLLASPYPSNPSSGEKGKLGVSVWGAAPVDEGGSILQSDTPLLVPDQRPQ